MSLINSNNASKKEVSLFFNTLACLIKNLENCYTTVDLRNERCVTGKLVKVDAYMNLEMEDVILYDMRGNQMSLESFFVSARTIRNVHMPKNRDAIKLLTSQLDCMTKKRSKTKAKKTFKTSRAERKNMETIVEAYGVKESK